MRSLTFSPDGRTLLCGLHESLKVSSIFWFIYLRQIIYEGINVLPGSV